MFSTFGYFHQYQTQIPPRCLQPLEDFVGSNLLGRLAPFVRELCSVTSMIAFEPTCALHRPDRLATVATFSPRRWLDATDGLPRSQGKRLSSLSALHPLRRGFIKTCNQQSLRTVDPEVVDSSSRWKRSLPTSPPSSEDRIGVKPYFGSTMV